jgi:hypothetical protein
MEQTTKHFNLYDHLAFIMVGLYQLIILGVIYLMLSGESMSQLLALFDLKYSLILVLFSYMLGHIVQAVSNIFDKWERKAKEEQKNELGFVMKKARTFFDLPKEMSDKQVWQYCYLYALSNDFSGHILLFNSLHSLYRGLWVASGVGFLFLLASIIFTAITKCLESGWSSICWVQPEKFLFLLVLWGAFRLFNQRRKRFFAYMGDKVLVTFDILSKGKLN